MQNLIIKIMCDNIDLKLLFDITQIFHMLNNYSLTVYCLNSSLRSFSGHNLRYALFVYRLIVATLIGNFSDDPFLN